MLHQERCKRIAAQMKEKLFCYSLSHQWKLNIQFSQLYLWHYHDTRTPTIILQQVYTIETIALLIVSLSTSSVYCVCGQNAIAAPNNHGLAFTSLRTVTFNPVTPGRLHTEESAVQSVSDTISNNVVNDTATSDSVPASDGTETTPKSSFSQQNHCIIQSLCNRHGSHLTADRQTSVFTL